MATSSAFETAARRCFTTPEIVDLLSPGTTPLSLSSAPPASPPSSGSLFLYDRSATQNYKQDGHNWVMKPVSSNRGTVRVREDPARLRLGDHYRVAAYYARAAAGGGTMRRRSYRLIDPVSLKPENDLVLVHYLDADVVRQRHDSPIAASTACGKAEEDAKSCDHAARLVTNADEYSGSSLGLLKSESEGVLGKRKIQTSADGSDPFNEKLASYEVDSSGTPTDTDILPCHWIGHSRDVCIPQNSFAVDILSAQHSHVPVVSRLLASPKMAEEDVVHEWLSYSKVERNAIINDIYGSEVSADYLKESSNYIAHSNFAHDLQLETWKSKISLMNQEISKMQTLQKACYLEALRQCPHIACSMDFKIQFLRCENFCPRAAAQRLVSYWSKRVEMFGKDAFVPLTLEGTMADYYKKPSFGRAKLLPGLDSSGRAIILVDNTIPCTKEAALRGLWYMVHASLEYDNVKRNGYVLVVNGSSSLEEFDRQGKLEQQALVRDILPVKCRAFHLCNLKTGPLSISFVKVLVSALAYAAGPYIRSRGVFHDGSMEQVNLQLAEYGISKNQLPATMGGTFTEEAFRKWLALRKEAKL